MHKLIKGKVEGVEMEVFLPDDAPPGDVAYLLRKLKEFLDGFVTLEDFHHAMERVVDGLAEPQIGH